MIYDIFYEESSDDGRVINSYGFTRLGIGNYLWLKFLIGRFDEFDKRHYKHIFWRFYKEVWGGK